MMTRVRTAAAWIAVGFVAVGIGIGGAQTAKRPMTFADLMAMKRVSDPQISPSGKWVMFSVTDVSLEKNTKVNHLVGGADLGPTSQATADSSASLRNDKGEGLRNDSFQMRSGRRRLGEGETNGRFSPYGKLVSLTMKGQIYEMNGDDCGKWDAGGGGARLRR